jgi:hypothetical protein
LHFAWRGYTDNEAAAHLLQLSRRGYTDGAEFGLLIYDKKRRKLRRQQTPLFAMKKSHSGFEYRKNFSPKE